MASGGATQRLARQCPADFETVFVEIGRVACQEHYGAGRLQVDCWLEIHGKTELIAKREQFIRDSGKWGGEAQKRPCPPDFDIAYVQLGPTECERRYTTSGRTIRRWVDERGRDRLTKAREDSVGKLTRREVGTILKRAFPVRKVSPTLARHAAQHLRKVRNGGFIVSPAPGGEWWVGSRKRSASELLELAIRKGFDPSLAGER